MMAVMATRWPLPRARSCPIEGPEDRVAAGGGECRHGERPAHLRAAAVDVPLAGGPAAVAVEGRQPGQRGDPGAVELAQFGQLSEQTPEVGDFPK